MHSSASDGEMSPSELVRFAAQECGVQVLALTDHDTVGGIDEAAREAQRIGVKFISGIEMSSSWESVSIHVVGLGVDPHCTLFLDAMKRLCRMRDERAREIGDKLAALGIPGMYEQALRFAGSEGNIIGRPHFAQALFEGGYVPTVQLAFDRYLGRGKPAYVISEWGTVPESVHLIERAGGIAVLAHPGRYFRLNESSLEDLVRTFVEAGGRGIEVVSGSQPSAFEERCVTWARKYNLLASTGSDFHGLHAHRPRPGEQGRLPEHLPTVLDVLKGFEDGC